VEFEFDEESVAVEAAPELVDDPLEDAPDVEAADDEPAEEELGEAAALDDEEDEAEDEDEEAAEELEELEELDEEEEEDVEKVATPPAAGPGVELGELPFKQFELPPLTPIKSELPPVPGPFLSPARTIIVGFLFTAAFQLIVPPTSFELPIWKDSPPGMIPMMLTGG